MSNKKLVNQTIYEPQLKLRESIMVFKAASIKQPAQKDAIFVKGIAKFSPYIVTGFNALLSSLGSIDSTAAYLKG